MSQDDWRFINTFSPWFSAIGTLVAVIATIYFSRRDKYVNLTVTSVIVKIISEHYPNSPNLVRISVVNNGIRRAKLTSLGFKIGKFKPNYLQFIPHKNDYISSNLPIVLNDGEYANYFFAPETLQEIIDSYPNNLSKKNIKVTATTSTGKTFKNKIDSNLKNKIKELIKEKK